MFWTVRELVKELEKYNQDLEVSLNTMECHHPIEKITVDEQGNIVLQPFN